MRSGDRIIWGGLEKPGTYADLQARHDSLLVAEADTLRPHLIGGRCPFCVKLGWQSRVTVPMTGRGTLMAWQSYHDEKGVLHDGDPNIYTFIYRCSKGHQWNEAAK